MYMLVCLYIYLNFSCGDLGMIHIFNYTCMCKGQAFHAQCKLKLKRSPESSQLCAGCMAALQCAMCSNWHYGVVYFLPSLKDNGMTIGTIGTAGIAGSGGKRHGRKSM